MKKPDYARWRSQQKGKGFSLTEIIIVIVIIAVLALAAIFGGSSTVKKAQMSRVTSDLHNFDVAIQSYMGFKSGAVKLTNLSPAAEFNKTIDDLNKYLSTGYTVKPVALEASGNVHSTVSSLNIYESEKKDPWDNPYYLLLDPAARNAGCTEYYITVLSAGPDSQADIGGPVDKDDVFLLAQYSNGTISSHTYSMQKDTQDATGTPLTVGETSLSSLSGTSNPRNAGNQASGNPGGSGGTGESGGSGSLPGTDRPGTGGSTGHTHTWGAWTMLNGTSHKRTCTGDTSHVETGPHDWGSGVVTKEPYVESGIKTYTCSVCGGKKTETLAPTHTHDWSAWTKVDETSHKRTCTTDSTHVETKDHTWDAGVVTKEPYVEAGVKTYTCTGCGCTKTETLAPTHTHTWGTWTKVNETTHKRTCTTDSTHVETQNHTWNDGVVTKEPYVDPGIKTYTCTGCGCTKTETLAPTHTHTWGAWTMLNGTSHKRTCTTDTSHVETGTHDWGSGVITKEPYVESGIKTYTCSVCGGTKTEALPPTHTHTWGTWTKVDETSHKRTCTTDASHVETQNHTWDAGVVTKEPYVDPGIKTYTCFGCGCTKTETLAPTHTHTWGVWTKVDDIAHQRTCASDPSHVETGTHDWDAGVVTKEPTAEPGIRTRTCTVCGAQKQESIAYLTFSSPSEFQISAAAPGWTSGGGTIEYSTDKETWTTWGGAAISANSTGGNYALYLRGTGNQVITGTGDASARWRITGSNVKCSGNIEALLDHTSVAAGNHPTMRPNCFSYMFDYCTSLTTAPVLPATTLAASCYYAMFRGCTSLTSAPALPATTLAKLCYSNMFKGCTSLTTAPALPATSLAKNCYSNMFFGCTSLTTAPELPATTLADYCYYYMFQGCTSLTTAPALPATTLADYCYYNMFSGCTSLTAAPELPATTLAGSCYDSMFKGCTSLTAAPELPATTLAGSCYDSMFKGCTSLTAAPELPATTLAGSCYDSMFSGCTSLTAAPELPATTLAGSCYDSMFSGCTSLTTAPALPATTLADYCYYNMFSGCTSLTTAPELPATTLPKYCYDSMFSGCTSLTTAPALPATTLAESCYSYMFYGCKRLTKAPQLPATTLARSCYNAMFCGCKSLTTVPALPATTLAVQCYSNMFNGCTSLKVSATRTDEYTTAYRIPMSGTGVTATDALTNMFLNTGGTFTGTPDINTTYYLSSSNCVVGAEILPPAHAHTWGAWTKVDETTHKRTCAADPTHVETQNHTWNDGVVTKEPYVDPGEKTYTCFGCGCTKTETLAPTHTHAWSAWTKVDDIAHQRTCSGDTSHVETGTHDWDAGVVTKEPTAEPGIKTYTCSVCNGTKQETIAYLTFSSPSEFQISVATPGWTSGGGTIEYSTDKNTWTTWDGTAISANSASGNYALYLRGTGNRGISRSTSVTNKWSITGSNVKCSGNIEALLDHTTVAAGNHPAMGSSCFSNMFYGCTSLTTAPALPATTLANYCYSGMFYGCTSLTSAPTLPATTLADSCYYEMFRGCTSLTTAPVLPATTLAFDCYKGMFWNCTSLTSAPQLPATTLAYSCYYEMFRGCTSLTTAPALPATTLAGSCYYNMFYGCSSLTSTPTLPATTLADSCYYEMFRGCTSLTTAPALPATALAGNCYSYMFYGCTGLTAAPQLPATALVDSCYFSMFSRCTSLTTAPQLPATTLANYCYTGMFEGCTSLTTAPKLPATNLANYCYNSMFEGCTRLTSTPTLPATTLAEMCYTGMFEGCTSLTSTPALPATALANYCYNSMFEGCTSLTSAPTLPATTLANSCYSSMFKGCTSLTTAPQLPATTLADYCYYEMFRGCTSLTSAPSLPATTLADSCYDSMFYGCTSLTTAPQLPATTLAEQCYSSMFSRCSKMTTAPALPATTLASNCYSNMFYGCTSLKLSPTRTGEYTTAYRLPKSGTGTTANYALYNMFSNTGGTFRGTPDINTTYYLSSSNRVVG